MWCGCEWCAVLESIKACNFYELGSFRLEIIIAECLIKNENMSYEVIRDHTSMLLINTLHIQKQKYWNILSDKLTWQIKIPAGHNIVILNSIS